MESLFFILAIGWVIFTSVAKKKQKEAQEAARRRNQSAPGPAAPPVVPQRPFNPFFDTPAAPYASAEKATAPKAPAQPQAQAPRQAPPPRAAMQPAPQYRGNTDIKGQTAMTQMRETVDITKRHTLSPGGAGSHAHQETSLTGIEADCPPETIDVHAVQQAASYLPASAAATAFHWNANGVRQGLVMAEILGKPKALRR